MKSVTIRGITYPSIAAAAKQLGVDQASIGRAMRRGTLDNVGLGSAPAVEITIRGVTYRSLRAAAQKLGGSKERIAAAMRNGTLDSIGPSVPQEKNITIRGVTYGSQLEAARDLGISPSTLSEAAFRGTLDKVGTKRGKSNTDRAKAPVANYPSPALDRACGLNGGGRNRSHRISQLADRYAEILRRNPSPALSDAETNLIRDALNGTLYEPAEMIRGIWQGVEDAIHLDGLASKWDVDGPALVEKLRGLSYAQEVALVEAVEAWWSAQGVAGAA